MKKLAIIKWVSNIVFALTLLALLLHIAAQFIHKPLKEVLLMNEQGAVYQNGDLSKAVISTGETRQFFYDFLDKNMDLDHKFLATSKQYAIRLDGNGKRDVPDYRDVVRPYFTAKGYAEFMKAMETSPLLRNFWEDGKYIRTIIPTPPQSSDLSFNEGKVNPATKRLEYSYVGSFYSTVYGRTEREVRYKVDYTAKLIRVPAIPPENNAELHYFKPLVNENYTGMKIDSFSWNVGG
jgi:hypothetical protein